MSRILLDTHSILCIAFDDERLSATARSLVANPDIAFLVSVASPWEMAVKIAAGKLTFEGSVSGLFRQHVLRRNTELLAFKLGGAIGPIPRSE